MRKLFVLAAATMIVAPVLADELTAPGNLDTGDTATLTITASIPRYVEVITLDKTITFDATATGATVIGTSLKSATSATIEVQGNVDLEADVHFGSPLRLSGNTGGYNGYTLPTRLDLTYWGSVTKAPGEFPATPFNGVGEISDPLGSTELGVSQKYMIEHGPRLVDNKGLKLEIFARIDRKGLNDPYGDYAQMSGLAGELVADPTMVTFTDLY